MDATPDARVIGPVMMVSRNSAVAMESGGMVTVPTPSDAKVGDIVILYLDRYNAGTPLAAANNWREVGTLGFDGDSQQIFYRLAAADEQTLTAAYTFAAGTLGPNADASWVLEVWRGASEAQRVFATYDGALTTTLSFPAASATANEVVIDIVVAQYDTPCPDPPTVDDRVLWAILAHPLGDAPAVTVTCDLNQTYGRFQLRVVP